MPRLQLDVDLLVAHATGTLHARGWVGGWVGAICRTVLGNPRIGSVCVCVCLCVFVCACVCVCV